MAILKAEDRIEFIGVKADLDFLDKDVKKAVLAKIGVVYNIDVDLNIVLIWYGKSLYEDIDSNDCMSPLMITIPSADFNNNFQLVNDTTNQLKNVGSIQP